MSTEKPATNDTSGGRKKQAMTTAMRINDENTKPLTGEYLDIVLVPVDPRLFDPSVAAPGTRLNVQVDRRRRMFAAKRILAEEVVVMPRKKRVARKSLLSNKKAMTSVQNNNWDDYFHNQQTDNQQQNKDPSSTMCTTGKPKTSSKVKPVEVYRGPPDDDLEEFGGWPPGWIKTTLERKEGVVKGRRDKYWFSPGGKRFRSFKDVKGFLKALAACGGHEDQAQKIFKQVAAKPTA